MREHSLGELGAAWAQLVATYGQARPDLAGAVLGAVQRYVPWIDIGLVANDKRAPAPRQELVCFLCRSNCVILVLVARRRASWQTVR